MRYTYWQRILKGVKTMSKENRGVRRVSFLNWFFTLIVSAIPGVNILFFVITIAAARNASKKSFAVAALVLSLLLLIAACALVFFFGNDFVRWAENLPKDVPTTEA